MKTTTPTDAERLVRPQIPRRLAMRLAATEYERTTATLAALSAADWSRPTPCTEWDVRQLACHMVGMATMVSTPWEMARQQKKATAIARADGLVAIDALTGLQVAERADWSPARIADAARSIGPRAARGRRFTPPFIRSRPFPDPQHLNGQDEHWVIGFLSDVILTRDPWLHRMDIAAATGTEPVLTAEHDGAIVADVVDEWSRRHDASYDLELTGPAGGHWQRGNGGERISMDAVGFCRAISGRADAPGLLAVQVPF
ncbi:maleylpyruvate isomerase family mycothiol-dependent enzyme [Nocardioides stalactiti]|uniref:maleylpyruvate isomerase family mycothiol-dependent enzyme n=1 Tax=Nocardioides stalactiti TaxID=2755356 RepID=UPI001601034E|nr:maleylpyruvate isomerase family mycothiol-dependent enzyme [Nocardioides stalactiti]